MKEVEMPKEIPVPEDWVLPSDFELKLAEKLLLPWTRLATPEFLNLERIPKDRPVLFIINHTFLGVLDAPLLFIGLHKRTGHFARAMGDHIHFMIPAWRKMLMRWGVVHGTRDNCRTLMKQKESVVIFPGGAREVFKRRGEKYQLLWGKRAGFARMAFESDYTIVPIAAVGAEDCYNVLLDQNDIFKTPLRSMFEKHAPRQDVMFPTVPVGLFGTMLPIPQKFYFSSAEPIESKPYKDWDNEEEAIFALREEVRLSLEAEIASLLEYRENDQQLSSFARIKGIFLNKNNI